MKNSVVYQCTNDFFCKPGNVKELTMPNDDKFDISSNKYKIAFSFSLKHLNTKYLGVGKSQFRALIDQ